jgi:hypothetical protein
MSVPVPVVNEAWYWTVGFVNLNGNVENIDVYVVCANAG